jgi:threonylcarbamoyladenosine tRNA methylthiotransferase MtaB
MRKTFLSFSFGCRVNEAEREKLDQQLLSHGFNKSEENPSFYIINSCAVTVKAEREVRQFIYQVKRRFPKTKIIITGCSATLWETHKSIILGVDLVVENIHKDNLVNIMLSYYKIGKKIYSNTKDVHDKFIDSGRLLIKIQDGCSRFCTFCIVPYLRGRPKSRKIEEIIRQINGKKNIQEVILTAINTEAFGLDTHETFVKLLESTILKTIVPRISLGSINPWSIDDKFYNFYKHYKSTGRLVDFFHIPLQSGSNKVLELMNRGYTREEFGEKIKMIHDINPMAFIATDVIVGFLDESEKDFEDTYNFLVDSPISKLHVFRYSPREKTAAYYMKKLRREKTPVVKTKRTKILLELGKKKYQQFLEKHIGKTFPALFLARRQEGFQEALLNNQIPVLIKTEGGLAGKIREVRIEALKKNCLFARGF